MVKKINPVVNALHDGAAASLLLRSVGILALVDLRKKVLVRMRARCERSEESRSHTCPHTDGTMKSRVLLQ